MRNLIIFTVIVSLFMGCAELKFRWKNANGDRSQAQMDRDWKDCYEHTSNQYAMNRCVEKKGYYSESFTE